MVGERERGPAVRRGMPGQPAAPAAPQIWDCDLLKERSEPAGWRIESHSAGPNASGVNGAIMVPACQRAASGPFQGSPPCRHAEQQS